MNLKLNETFIYRHRLLLGYGLFAISLILILGLASQYYPGGLSAEEIESATISGQVNFRDPKTLAIPNLPYHLFQKLSFILFGVTLFSIKLPSLILALFSAIGIVLLLRQWFKPSVSVLTSLVTIYTSQFIFFAQNGTPDIIYICWPIWLILIGNLIIQKEQPSFWTLLLFLLSALGSLYSPLGIYVFIIIAVIALLHPHLRHKLRQLPKLKLLISFLISLPILVFLLPLARINTQLLPDLLGFSITNPDLIVNLKVIWRQYFNFSAPSISSILTPFYDLGAILLILIGGYHLIKEHFMAKNYLVIIWIVSAFVINLVQPTFYSLTFFPMMLLIANGLNFIVSYWYKLFPKNPYARIGGLIPLTFFISILIISGINRHIFSYNYEASLVNNFSKDLLLLDKSPKTLLVSDQELPFYNVMATHNNNLSVTTTPNGDFFWATRLAKQNYQDYQVDRIITSSTTEQADRFYLYSKKN